MKLPAAIRTGVQSMGRHDIMGPMRVANAEAAATANMMGAVEGAMNVATGIYEAERTERINNRAAEMKLGYDSARRQIMDATAYDIKDEKIQGLKYEKKNADGTDRQTIDASEVQAQMWERWKGAANDMWLDGYSDRDKKQLTSMLQPVARSATDNVISNALQKTSATMQNKTMRIADSLADAGEIDEAIAHVEASEVFTSEEKTAKVAGLEFRHEKNQVNAASHSRDPEQILAQITRLDDESYDGTFTPAQQDASVRTLRAQLTEVTQQDRIDHTNKHNKFVGNLDLGIASGATTEAMVEQFYADWEDDPNNAHSVDDGERIRLIKAVRARNSGRAKDQAADFKLERLLKLGLAAAPGDNDVNDAIDRRYDGLVRDLPPDQAAVAGFELADSTNRMPENMKFNIASMVRSQNAQWLTVAAGSYGPLYDKRRNIGAQFDDHTRVILETTYELQKGTPNAAQLIIDNWKDLTPEIRAGRLAFVKDDRPQLKDLQDMVNDDPNFSQSFIADVMNFESTTPPAIIGKMMGDFDRAFDEFYISHEDPAMAKKLAWDHIRSRYGQTRLNNSAAIKHGMPTAWMQDMPADLVTGIDRDTLEGTAQKYADDLGYSRDDLWFETDIKTRRDPHGEKSWGVYTFDATGRMYPVMDGDGVLARYVPAQLQGAVQEELFQADLAREQALRKRKEKGGGRIRGSLVTREIAEKKAERDAIKAEEKAVKKAATAARSKTMGPHRSRPTKNVPKEEEEETFISKSFNPKQMN